MLRKWMFVIIILLASIKSAKVLGLDIFQMRHGYKHVIDQFQLVETSGKPNRPEKWFKQPLDHFDLKQKKYWNMRYFDNLEFWKKGGPIYIFLGGAGLVPDYLITVGMIYDLANETNGGMYAAEHRYYGESRPVSGTSAEDFKFLSAEQALLDVLNFISDIKSNFTESKIIVIGESYSGNLAAWIRELYPDHVYAAYACSAPVLAKKDFYEYAERVGYDYEYCGGEDCINKIKHMFNRYDMLFNSTAGIEQLKVEENICSFCDMTLPLSKQVFFYAKITYFGFLPECGTVDLIKRFCKIVNGSNLNSQSFWNARVGCFDYSFRKILEYIAEENDVMAWVYQTCNEFGYFMTTTSNSQPFTKNLPIELFIKICTTLFGEEFNEERVNRGVKETNKRYGGLSPNVTQVIFSNGELDPWSRLGILKDLSDKVPAVVIPKATFCRELLPRRCDNKEIKEAREHIKSIIKKWVIDS